MLENILLAILITLVNAVEYFFGIVLPLVNAGEYLVGNFHDITESWRIFCWLLSCHW